MRPPEYRGAVRAGRWCLTWHYLGFSLDLPLHRRPELPWAPEHGWGSHGNNVLVSAYAILLHATRLPDVALAFCRGFRDTIMHQLAGEWSLSEAAVLAWVEWRLERFEVNQAARRAQEAPRG